MIGLVNAGDDRCCACDRPAVGRSIGAHPLCAAHHGWAAELGEEYAREVEASKARLESVMERARARCAEDSPVSPLRYSRGQDAAAGVNLEKAQRAKVIRDTAVLTAMGRACSPVTASFLAQRTKLSLATVKRTLAELALERRITATKPPKAHAYLYDLGAS